VLSYRLEARFREAIGEPSPSPRDETIGFAVDFVRLLAHALPDPVTDAALRAVRTALQARTDLTGQEADTLVELACTPEHRAAIDEDQIRAFGDRFGRAREEALRTSLAEEVRFSAFAERYGAIESLLLLDALFAVCGEDGVISRNEIAGLQKAAADLQIDPVLVSALFRKHDSRHATGDFQFQLERRSYVVGRSGGADIQLPDPQVGHRHVELVPTPNGWRILDLGSGRPTLLNGVRVASAPFRPQDELRVGPYALKLGPSGDVLTAFGKGAVSALSARGLKRRISARSGDVVLLDDVSFTVFSGEVIALVGPSGAGKTTLLHAITGIAPPDDGDVLLDDQDFHRLLQADRSLVGVVPQEDVVHAELTVEESLRWAARLRLGAGVSAARTSTSSVDRVLRELGIEHIREFGRSATRSKRGVSGGATQSA
jgi:ABC-type multidrug transport system fused ATPase/permease subunit